jgi:hypothetical protein
VEEKLEIFTQRKKGKGRFQSTEGKKETHVHKGKGTKRPLERKDETSGKGIEKPVVRKDETPVQREKNKSRDSKEPDEVDKTLTMQEEEESEENPINTEHATVPPNSHTYKRLIKQLRDARKEITHLKVEDKVHLDQMEEIMVGYNHTLELARFATRKALPLHKQLKNLYRQNRGFQSQNRKLKAELKHFQDEAAQRNLQVLVEDVIEDDKSTTKESTATLKKLVNAKKKKSVVSIFRSCFYQKECEAKC